MEPTLVVRDIDVLLTMDPAAGEGRLGRIQRGAVAFEGDTVCWVGPSAEAPTAPDTVDGSGTVGLPGLVDCHTHATWAGSRAREFELRLAGATYTELLEAGGGILSTVEATRAAPEVALVDHTVRRIRGMIARGVTTVEIKSGYGLEEQTEARMLRAARAAGAITGARVVTTFLGAHTVPAELRHDPAAYVERVVTRQLPLCAPLANCVDVYVDRGAFTVEQGRRVLEAGRAHGLVVRVHAEQVEHTGAAAMAAKLGATSADHLERIDADGIAALAEAGTVGVLLPGAQLYLRDVPPPVAALREAGVPLAVATDLNPGSSPVHDLWACATLACLTMGLTVEEALLGVTCHAARALGRPELGVLAGGRPADLALVRPAPGEPPSAAGLVQHLGAARAEAVFVRGRRLFASPGLRPSPVDSDR